MIVVVGSGPSGVSAAHALLRRGHAVTMLDGGVELEADRADIVRRLQGQAPDQWAPADVARLKDGMISSPKGVPLKYCCGSDFPYRFADAHMPTRPEGVNQRLSLALGGLSTVWGASMMPFETRDMFRWPVTAEDLAPHYRSVLSFLPQAGTRDALDSTWPLYGQDLVDLELSVQGQKLLAALDRRREALSAAGIRFGRARLGVAGRGPHSGQGCVYCGLCLYGCPHELIYNSAFTLERLREHPRFTYRGGVVVDRVREEDRQVVIEARELETLRPFRLTAARLCLACGAMASTYLLMRSLDLYDRPLTLQDSQYYLFPLLRLAGGGDVFRERLHTLAQLFLEVRDERISPATMHLQLYSYNDLMLDAMRRMTGRAYALFRWPIRALLRRMIIVQGYLHSDLSPCIEVVLERASGDQPPVLAVRRRAREIDTAKTVRRLVGKLRWNLLPLATVPLKMMLQVEQAGRGYHTGGSFPMSRNPGPLESDLLGRPAGLRRVHAVDSTTFPCVPATTITFTAMANAHRIASALDDE